MKPYTSLRLNTSVLGLYLLLIYNELRNYDMWLKCNKLSVNVKKTNYVIFKSRQGIANGNFNILYSLEFNY